MFDVAGRLDQITEAMVVGVSWGSSRPDPICGVQHKTRTRDREFVCYFGSEVAINQRGRAFVTVRVGKGSDRDNLKPIVN
jgi:hypothetical protein